MCLALLGGGSGCGKLFFFRTGTVKCFYILLCPVTGKGFFLNELSLAITWITNRRNRNLMQSTLNQIYLEIGKHNKDFCLPYLSPWRKASDMVSEMCCTRKTQGGKNEWWQSIFSSFLHISLECHFYQHYFGPVSVSLKKLHLLSVFILYLLFLFYQCF